MRSSVREKVENIIPKLLREPTDTVKREVEASMTAEAFVFSSEWVYDPIEDRKKEMAKCCCSACESTIYLEKASLSPDRWEKHNFGFYDPETGEKVKEYERLNCPMCEARVQALRRSKIRNVVRLATRYVAEAQNIDGVFCLSAWWVEKMCDKNGRAHYYFNQNEGFMVVENTPIRYNGYSGGQYGKDNSSGWFYKEKFVCEFGKWTLAECYGIEKAMLGSSIEKSGLDVFLAFPADDNYPSEYISAWIKYPQLENLVKTGLSGFVREILNKSVYSGTYYYRSSTFHVKDVEKYIDKSKFKPHEMLMCQKNEVKDILTVNCEAVAFRKEIIDKLNFSLSFGEAHEACKRGGDILIKLFTGEYGYKYPIKRTLNYLDKQIEKRRRGGAYQYDGIVDARYYRDYIEMVAYVQGTIPEELRFPKDLVKAHKRFEKLKRDKVSDELNEKIRDFGEDLSDMSFTDEKLGLTIRPALSHKELIDEGKKLSHCVATYASRVSRRETSIFFIRRIDKMDEPYFTLEFNIKNNYVVQNRGKRNCARTDEVKTFEQEWLDYIKTIKQKGKKNAKRVSDKECIGAGA